MAAYSTSLEHTFDFRTEIHSSARVTLIEGKVLSRLWNASCKTSLEDVLYVKRRGQRRTQADLIAGKEE